MSIIVAFSTTDGKKLANTHFGDGSLYVIYEISDSEMLLIKTVANTSTEEDDEIHGDPNKAKEIKQILQPLGVQVVCGKQFGKNIKRMLKHFVPVISSANNTDDACKLIQQNYEAIDKQWQMGEKRKHLRF